MNEYIALITGIVTLIVTCLGIIVSNHKLKAQLVEDVKNPIKEMKKEVAETRDTVDKLKAQVNKMSSDMETTDKLTSDALLSLLRHRLTESGHKYIKLGYIVEDELEAFTNEYNSYSRLGGNHYVTALYCKIMELPVRSVEEQEQKAAARRKSTKTAKSASATAA